VTTRILFSTALHAMGYPMCGHTCPCHVPSMRPSIRPSPFCLLLLSARGAHIDLLVLGLDALAVLARQLFDELAHALAFFGVV